jgi:hypothetical protein
VVLFQSGPSYSVDSLLSPCQLAPRLVSVAGQFFAAAGLNKRPEGADVHCPSQSNTRKPRRYWTSQEQRLTSLGRTETVRSHPTDEGVEDNWVSVAGAAVWPARLGGSVEGGPSHGDHPEAELPYRVP